MLRFCLLFFCVHLGHTFILSQSAKWNGLEVTWSLNIFSSHAFDSLPRTETAAKNDGFSMISDCGASPHFAGKRYAKNGDTAVVLLFDAQGYIAGIQAGISKTQPNGYPQSPLQNHPFVLDDDKQFVTAYFVDPNLICSTGRTAAMYNKDGTGTDLFIQNGTSPSHVMKIPHIEADLKTTKWTKGKCFLSMGMHYWYNIRKDMSCDEFYPVFLLYNGGKLNAFGWAFNADLSSTRYEHPPHLTFGAFLHPVPDCLSQQGRLSTLHIYLTGHPALDTC